MRVSGLFEARAISVVHSEMNRALVAWVPADLGLDADELERERLPEVQVHGR
jgi:hypothetical protein